MAKPRKSPPNVSKQPNPIPGEPAAQSALAALRSTADKLREQKEARRKAEEITIENVEQYIKDINQILSTESGMRVFKSLLRYTRMFNVPTSGDNVKMVEENGMKRLYLNMIRQFLKPTIKSALEDL